MSVNGGVFVVEIECGVGGHVLELRVKERTVRLAVPCIGLVGGDEIAVHLQLGLVIAQM